MIFKVFTCTDHDFNWPVGVASTVVAKDRTQAKKLLDQALRVRGLKPWNEHKYTLVELDIGKPHATVLLDGDY